MNVVILFVFISKITYIKKIILVLLGLIKKKLLIQYCMAVEIVPFSLGAKPLTSYVNRKTFFPKKFIINETKRLLDVGIN